MENEYEKIKFGENRSRHYDSFEGRLLPVINMRMVWDRDLYSDEMLDTAEKAVNLVAEFIYDCPVEYGMCIALNADGKPICVGLLGIGDKNKTALGARSVMQFALVSDDDYIILLHNHPEYSKNGYLTKPSVNDIRMTDSVQRACDLCEVQLFDSIIVGRQGDEDGKIKPIYYSMREKKVKGIKFTKRSPQEIYAHLQHLNFPGGYGFAEKEEKIDWDNENKVSDNYWTYNNATDFIKNTFAKNNPPIDLKTIPQMPMYVAYNPNGMKNAIKEINNDIKENKNELVTDVQEHNI